MVVFPVPVSNFLFNFKNDIFHSWWFEPLVASCSFAFAIHVYWYQERKLGMSRNNHLWDTIGVTSTGDLYNSLGGYWIGIWIIQYCKDYFSLVATQQVRPDGLHTDLDSILFLLCEVVSGIILYDAIFFLIHWAMHEIPLLRKFHSYHHHNSKENSSLEARDVLRHSIVDGSLQVLVNICVQQYNPWWSGRPNKSRLARVLHNVVVTWMLTESHTSSPTPNIFRRWCVGVREHRHHHLHCDGSRPSSTRDGKYHYNCHRYQQFFGYLDNLRAWIMTNKRNTATKTVWNQKTGAINN